MKYAGMPWGMWKLFAKSFTDCLKPLMGMNDAEAQQTAEKAHRRYRKIIAGLPEFEKGDRFQMNIVSCAMFSAFLLSMPERPNLPVATEYYRRSMMTEPMRLFCRLSGRRKFTESDIRGMQETAAFRAADRNPYSWNMDFIPYENDRGYEARFTRCGICTLMQELGLQELIPAMCRLDYTMSEAGGVSDFVREYTLASGGPYCDCGYRKKV